MCQLGRGTLQDIFSVPELKPIAQDRIEVSGTDSFEKLAHQSRIGRNAHIPDAHMSGEGEGQNPWLTAADKLDPEITGIPNGFTLFSGSKTNSCRSSPWHGYRV